MYFLGIRTCAGYHNYPSLSCDTANLLMFRKKTESHGGRGRSRLLSENADFVQVGLDRWNSVGLTPSSTRGSRPGRPSESPNWHTGQSSPTFSLIADSYVSGDLIISPVWLRFYLVGSSSSYPNKTCFESSVCFENSYVPTLRRNEIINRVLDSPPIAIIHTQRRHHPSAIFTLQYFIPHALGGY